MDKAYKSFSDKLNDALKVFATNYSIAMSIINIQQKGICRRAKQLCNREL